MAKNLESFELIFPEKNKEGKRFFPDGEVYMRLSGINSFKNRRIIVLHSGAPNPNNGLMELDLILQILKDHKIRPELFFTYFPYSRQDKVFQRGETNAAENLIKKAVKYYKVRKIYAIDPHFGKMPWLKKYPVISVSAAHLLMQKAREDFGQDILFLSPDRGGKRRTGISGLNKKRIDSFGVDFYPSQIIFRGGVIGVIDDILATGGTLSKFYDYASASGASKVIALITHAPFKAGVKRVKNKFFKLYLTNTVKIKEANVDISRLIADNLK
ncbi:MAG: ribose-phosphate pyrophosphokinase [Candidatus Nealsonbacteria bacterium]|nr:ribose-phosphate pyrophosphokinase [Candidatus Nealsonbacteria bacterium]